MNALDILGLAAIAGAILSGLPIVYAVMTSDLPEFNDYE